MAAILIWLALLGAGLGLVALLEARQLWALSRAVVGSMDRGSRRVGMIALVPAVGTAVWLVIRGVDLPACVVVGLVCGFGVFALLLAVLGMEGLLLETSSAAALRIAQAAPPPSTRRGRIVAGLVGAVAIAACAYGISMVSR